MTVIIYKNNEFQKSFRKFFPCYNFTEIIEWTNSHFTNAKKKTIEMKYNNIYIFY